MNDERPTTTRHERIPNRRPVFDEAGRIITISKPAERIISPGIESELAELPNVEEALANPVMLLVAGMFQLVGIVGEIRDMLKERPVSVPQAQVSMSIDSRQRLTGGVQRAMDYLQDNPDTLNRLNATGKDKLSLREGAALIDGVNKDTLSKARKRINELRKES